MRRRFALAAFVLVAVASVPVLTQDRSEKSGSAAGVVSGKHLKVRVSESDAIIAPGGALTLALDVTPDPKIHVYAPGQDGYIPVALVLAASTDFTSLPPVFPSARSIFFEPTAEQLKVYDLPFRVTAKLTLASTPALERRAAAHEKLTVTGVLAYQACDDAVCYRPDAVPLTWEIGLTPRGR